MATYIMLHIEYRLKTEGCWKHINWDTAFMSRGYSTLCAYLGWGGVEGSLPLRGLPQDITQDTRESIYHEEESPDPDYTDFTWCSTDELERTIELAYDAMQLKAGQEYDLRGQDEYLEWKAVVGYMKILESSNRYLCRAVYWFF